MKLSTTTALAILASSTFVAAAPIDSNTFTSEQTLVKREQIRDVLDILDQLQHHQAKRDLAQSEEELLELYKREGSLISSLLSSLINSGIIGQVFNKLVNDPTVSKVVKSLIQAAIQTATVQGVALVKALFNSGLLKDIFNSVMNDANLKGALIDIAKAFYTNSKNLLSSAFSGGAQAAAPAASKREEQSTTDLMDGAEYLDKRDLADIVSLVVSVIKNSGIVSTLVNKVMANPEQSIAFLTSALKTGLVVAQDIYNWSKDNGLLAQGLEYIKANGGTFGSIIADFFSGAISDGSVTTSEIDNAPAPSATQSTTTASTGTASTTNNNQAALASLAAKYRKRHLY
ncbi:Opaque-phase-specific protein OP4 [Spathaspora sp. JA1]|nr:Opaque-phase-specific protein OP4 [Spathaspora sp. JA1]